MIVKLCETSIPPRYAPKGIEANEIILVMLTTRPNISFLTTFCRNVKYVMALILPLHITQT